MPDVHTIKGSCECSRNIYVVAIPLSAIQDASVYFDTGATSRRLQAAPLTAFLRVPLAWYQSQTIPLFEDESHQSIRRHYSPAWSGDSRRSEFCGYCGSQLSSWNESTRDDADFISLTLGSILDEDLPLLESLRLLPSEEDDDADEISQHERVRTNENAIATNNAPPHSIRRRGAPWFEEMTQHSRLGRIRRQKGGHTSDDGLSNVTWEIIEIDGGNSQDDTPRGTRSKRKHATLDDGSAPESEEVEMQGSSNP